MTSSVPPALVNHLWQSTLFVFVVWMATLALRGNTARVRCWLWMAASVKFLVPLSVLVSLGEQFQWRDTPAAVQPTVLFVMEDAQDGRFTTRGPLHALIQAAYNVTRFQVEGEPAWVRSDRFAIEARPAGSATPDQMRGMLQSLLAERFKLTLRRETRTLPIYELAVADGGLKIAAMKDGDCIPPREIRWDLIDLEAPLYICDGGRRRVLSRSPETRPLPRWPRITRIEWGGASMSALIDLISVDLDRVVVDRTGFTSPFNFVLDFAPASDPAASGPTIFDALRDQLGLQLRSTSGPIDVLVIDRVEQPSQN